MGKISKKATTSFEAKTTKLAGLVRSGSAPPSPCSLGTQLSKLSPASAPLTRRSSLFVLAEGGFHNNEDEDDDEDAEDVTLFLFPGLGRSSASGYADAMLQKGQRSGG